jgi:hypothetical protein
VVLAQLAQERGALEPVTKEEMDYILDRCSALTRASAVALFTGLLSSLMPELSGRAGHRALKLYAEIAFQTHALYDGDAGHLCGSQLSAVL